MRDAATAGSAPGGLLGVSVGLMSRTGPQKVAAATDAAAPAMVATNDHFNLLRHFSVTSGLALLLMTLLFVAGYGWHQRSVLAQASKENNAELAQVIATTVWSRHSAYISGASNLTGDQLRAQPNTQVIDRDVREILAKLSVLKLKIYHPNALTVYSTEFKQIGESKLDNATFMQVLATKKPRSTTSFREKFVAYHGIVQKVHLAETYVPIVDADNKVIALFELYNDITRSVSEINSDTVRIALITMVVFALLYGILFMIVRRADAVIESQRTQLAAAGAKAASLNAELAVKVRELERSNKDLHDFAHVASHDLQEPLRKIEAFGGRLVRRFAGDLPDEGKMYVDRMQDAAGRMRQLITDLLAYARTDKSDAVRPLNLAEVIAGVVSDLQVRIEESGASIKVGKLGILQAEPTQMRQLFQNLIANGLKFRRPDATPEIKIASRLACSTPDAESVDQMVITVKDNGVGFDPKLKDRLFKVFQRLHNRSEYEGTGIGLATCRKIVEWHGGTIAVDAAPGEGATFTITLPLVQRQPETTAADTPHAVA